ncbi:glycosyltransferase family 4 protein [Falsirhodobacter algicola]|uniref:Glycosyltransferase n=1 Tax=Falsirhodobacter algicola TaxID=2692330 RepID=A0A8J8SK76_9RHOB|nr:glycosyltransferase family 4 protein [Falsirhodobacter algicola]QUS35099.1 glycosyltransferase [Falsirhodobacter algicola]
MKILLSAYACEPGGGSETGKGWRFAEGLARHGCDVTVLTCGSHHRAAIERHADIPPNLRFVWHDVLGWRGPGYEDARHIRQHYMAWQMTARPAVRRLLAQQNFDVIHHLTWTVLRWPSFLGGLGPRFVFGPVGGGEVAPAALRPALPLAARRREGLRDVINRWGRMDPTVRACLRRADSILVTDEATRRHIPARWHDKTTVLADIYAPPVRRIARATDPQAPRLLFAGRMEAWKGAQFALGALARLRRSRPGAVLTLAGGGPDEAYLRRCADDLGLGDAARFVGRVPHDRMTALYAAQDIFVFPSLHDSGPHVIGEALAHGLPVVCLNLGGPGVAVDASCGAVVPADVPADALHDRLADAIGAMLDAPGRMEALREGAYARAARFSDEARIADMVSRFYAPNVGVSHAA